MSDLMQTLLSQLGPAALVLVLALLGLKRLAHYDQELRHIRDKVGEHSKALRDRCAPTSSPCALIFRLSRSASR